MSAWKRWQDWATIVLGAVAFFAPFFLGIDLGSALAWTAYLMGMTIVVAGVIDSSLDRPNVVVEWLPIIFGAILFSAPWIWGTTATPLAWVAWIVGALAVLVSGEEMLLPAPRPSVAR